MTDDEAMSDHISRDFSTVCFMFYKGNSKSKVPCCKSSERIPALSWLAWIQWAHTWYMYSSPYSSSRKVCLRQSPRQMNDNKHKLHTHGVNPDPSPALWRAWRSIHGGTVVKVLCYKSEGRWFDPSWCHCNFLLTKRFRSHYGPGVDSASNRNEYQEHFLGVKAAGV